MWGYAEGETYFPYSPVLVVESDFAYTDELVPGESTTVEAFDFIDSENLEAMKTATFEVTRVSAY